MQRASALGYQIIINEETVEKIANYKADLINGKAVAGKYFREKISKFDLRQTSVYGFIELLLSTKKPRIFAEQCVYGNGTDWNSKELELLGDISVAVKAVAYDDGVWIEKMSTKYDNPLDVELMFTPGPLLSAGFVGINPDYQEVEENGEINQEKYNALVKRRLLPVLSYANNQAENDKKAFVVLPGIGCGCFAGEFRGQMESKLDIALQAIIKNHEFPNITGISLGLYRERLNIKKKINGVNYEVRGNGLPQLSHPQKYDEKFRDCKLYKVVAWDHVSLPGNDFFHNNMRCTDDGVSAAATNSMEVITGVKGSYRNGRYFPPERYKDWEEVAKLNDVKLVANTDNVIIVSRDGRFKEGAM